jgi:hypothetical protein
MTTTQPRDLIKTARKDVRRYQKDIESWKRKRDGLHLDGWVWEDLIDKANFVYGRIQKLDKHLRHADLELGADIPEEAYDEVDKILRAWLELSVQLQPQTARVQQDSSHAAGYDVLLENIRAAKGSLTPDDEFFNNERFIEYRDQSVDEHRAGLTEPLLDHDFAE